jgi:hypothetical protein
VQQHNKEIIDGLIFGIDRKFREYEERMKKFEEIIQNQQELIAKQQEQIERIIRKREGPTPQLHWYRHTEPYTE